MPKVQKKSNEPDVIAIGIFNQLLNSPNGLRVQHRLDLGEDVPGLKQGDYIFAKLKRIGNVVHVEYIGHSSLPKGPLKS